jgi:hypothetical protein
MSAVIKTHRLTLGLGGKFMDGQAPEGQVSWGICPFAGPFFLLNRQIRILFHDNFAFITNGLKSEWCSATCRPAAEWAGYRSVRRSFAMTCEWQ